MQVLIAYETAHGSTTATAERIADVLRERGAEVDVLRCREAGDVEDYDAFIVGAPVWAGNWLKPARRFASRHEELLATHPTAYFHASAAAGSPDEREAIGERMRERLERVAPTVKPVAIGNFAGVVDFDLYNLPVRLIMKSIMGRQGEPTLGRNDYRDWQRIETWAAEVYDLLAASEGA